METTPDGLGALMTGPRPHAVLDVRERGAYGTEAWRGPAAMRAYPTREGALDATGRSPHALFPPAAAPA